MKKFFISTIVAALVAALMGVFVACGDKDENKGPSDKQLATTAMANVQTLTNNMVDDVTASDYQVIGQASADGKMYKVTWTVSSDFENLADYVSVGEMDATTKQVTIKVSKASVEITYTLKATVKVGKSSASAEWTKTVPAGQAGEDQTEVSISFAKFADTGARIEFTDEQMVWQQNGITLTNTKGTNGTAITAGSNDYHARLYQGTNVKIEYPAMVKLVFHSETSNSYFDQMVTAVTAANLGTVTSDKDKGTVTLELAAPTNEIEFPATKQMRLTALDIIASKNGVSDADKVAGAKAALDIANKNFVATGTYDLPAEKNGATVTWALKEGTTSAYVEIEGGNKLKITSMPTTDNAEVKLTATIESNGVKDTKDFTITLVPLAIENDGTAEHPYTPAEAWDLAKLLTATSADEVYVKGYVVLPGTYAGDNFNNFDNMYIGDTYDAAKTYSSADYTNGTYGGIFYIFRPKAQGDYLTKDGLNAGDEVTFKGNLANYNGTSPQLANGVCVALNAAERTDEQIVAAAKSSVTLSKDTFAAVNENITLEATKKGANLEWKIKNGEELVTENEYVKIADGKLTVLKLPTSEDVTVTITVTIKSGEETDTKDFTVTVKAPEVVDDSAFVLTPSALKISGTQSYANYKGDHTVGTYTVNFSDAMIAKPQGYPDDTIQLKASSGVMKLTGNFTKIVIKSISTYDYGATFNNVTVTAGGVELTVTHKGSVNTGEKNNSGYEYKIHTFEYTVTGGNQEIVISKTNAGAANFESITFTLADSTTGGEEGEETETQTLIPDAYIEEK